MVAEPRCKTCTQQVPKNICPTIPRFRGWFDASTGSFLSQSYSHGRSATISRNPGRLRITRGR